MTRLPLFLPSLHKVACAALLLVAASAGAQAIFTCVDGQGRRLTRDRPIAECTDREQHELNPSGTLRRRVGPTLTEREQAMEDLRLRRLDEEKRRVADERRRDRALLMRYKTQAAHDAERQEALKTVDDLLVSARQRLTELQGQRSALQPDLDRLAREQRQPPATMRQQLADLERTLAAQQRYVAERELEKRGIHQRFDGELARLRQLWGGVDSPERVSR